MAADLPSCAVCRDQFVDPVILQCGHSFCRACIVKNQAFGSGGCRCPICRMSYEHEGWVRNIALVQMQEDAIALKEDEKISSPGCNQNGMNDDWRMNHIRLESRVENLTEEKDKAVEINNKQASQIEELKSRLLLERASGNRAQVRAAQDLMKQGQKVAFANIELQRELEKRSVDLVADLQSEEEAEDQELVADAALARRIYEEDVEEERRHRAEKQVVEERESSIVVKELLQKQMEHEAALKADAAFARKIYLEGLDEDPVFEESNPKPTKVARHI